MFVSRAVVTEIFSAVLFVGARGLFEIAAPDMLLPLCYEQCVLSHLDNFGKLLRAAAQRRNVDRKSCIVISPRPMCPQKAR
jgi:hypothetical protein